MKSFLILIISLSFTFTLHGQTIQDSVKKLYTMFAGVWIDTNDSLHILKISKDSVQEIQKPANVNTLKGAKIISACAYGIFYHLNDGPLAEGYFLGLKHNGGIQRIQVTDSQLNIILHNKTVVFKRLKGTKQ